MSIRFLPAPSDGNVRETGHSIQRSLLTLGIKPQIKSAANVPVPVGLFQGRYTPQPRDRELISRFQSIPRQSKNLRFFEGGIDMGILAAIANLVIFTDSIDSLLMGYITAIGIILGGGVLGFLAGVKFSPGNS